MNIKLGELVAANVKSPIMEINYKDLQPCENEQWKKVCPKCKVGLLLIERDLETFKLQQMDTCILCGQHVKFLDIEEMRKQDGIL
jgi:hypothetical protein